MKLSPTFQFAASRLFVWSVQNPTATRLLLAGLLFAIALALALAGVSPIHAWSGEPPCAGPGGCGGG